MIAYLGACFLMGFGIAVDVAMASIAYARFLQDRRQQLQWVTRITATHVMFPMIGYYWAISLQGIRWLQPLIGIIGFLLIAWFLLGIARSFFESEESADDASHRFGWPLILSVSWDALWSGPAKAAQAVGWTQLEVALSFPLAGLVVASAALLATTLGQRLWISQRTPRLVGTSYETIGKLLEFAIFSYFAFLSLVTFTFGWVHPYRWAALAAIATALLAIILPWVSHTRRRPRSGQAD